MQIKCRGFYLKGSRGQKVINEDLYKEFVTALINEEEALRAIIPQFKISFDKRKGKLYSHMQLKAFCSHVFQKRILLKPENSNRALYVSLPFGYDTGLLKHAIELSK